MGKFMGKKKMAYRNMIIEGYLPQFLIIVTTELLYEYNNVWRLNINIRNTVTCLGWTNRHDRAAPWNYAKERFDFGDSTNP